MRQRDGLTLRDWVREAVKEGDPEEEIVGTREGSVVDFGVIEGEREGERDPLGEWDVERLESSEGGIVERGETEPQGLGLWERDP